MRPSMMLLAAALITDLAPHPNPAPVEICEAAPWDVPVEATVTPPPKAPPPTSK